MATRPFELTRLDPNTFEHLVNSLALRVLGAGATGFGPGPDGGRDGLFEGEADYPSRAERWSGTWYIQAKYHAPHLSSDAQKWLQNQISAELESFARQDSKRRMPDNWIIATNVDPSAYPKTGTIDAVTKMIASVNPRLAKRTHIWGGQKIIDLLHEYPAVLRQYSAFLSSSDVISAIVNSIEDRSASVSSIIRELTITQLGEQQYTKLEQAGSSTDTRPGIHTLYTDLPYIYQESRKFGILATASVALSQNHSSDFRIVDGKHWDEWLKQPRRSRLWFVRGGPGNGKSTFTQYICQINRAAIIDAQPRPLASAKILDLASEIKARSSENGYWPKIARIPVLIELRSYARWYGSRDQSDSRGVLTYLSNRLTTSMEQEVLPNTLRRALGQGRWLFIFDGLDEVPADVKDPLAAEVNRFIDDTIVSCRSDCVVICTSRPQGYSGQFDELNPTVIDLAKLEPEEALLCAEPVLAIDRTPDEFNTYKSVLRDAVSSPAVREIMTTPLQSHIMAVVVRDGGRPPERKWALYSNFYEVIKKREANRNLSDPGISKILREGGKLIKTLHNRLGFELHYRAERATGAETSIGRSEFRGIIASVVNSLQDKEIEPTISILDRATTERLVLVNTPESGEYVRFDIRPLQEFFAAEYLYETAPEGGFVERIRAIASDSHWREVMHFLISALVEQERRGELAQAVEVLAELDNDPNDRRRALSRRLCIGGMISARLLREGVAEADKKTRALFRACLPPLLASTDAGRLLALSPPTHTASWLAGVMMDAINEQVAVENVGAACIAPLLPVESDDRAGQLISYLSGQTRDYANVFLTSVVERGHLDICPEWVIDFAIDAITVHWRNNSSDVISNAYMVLTHNVSKMSTRLRKRGISSRVARFASMLMSGYVESRGRSDIEHDFLFGLLHVEIVPSIPDVNPHNWDDRILEGFRALGGAFEGSALLARAYLTGAREDLSAVREFFGPETRLLANLPPNVRALLVSERGARGSVSSAEMAIRQEHQGRFLEYSLRPTGGDDVEWSKVVEKFPDVGMMYLEKSRGPQNKSFRRWVDDPQNTAFFLECLRTNEEGYAPTLSDVGAAKLENRDLRRGIIQIIADNKIASVGHAYSRIGRGFRVDLPTEQSILPHVAAYIAPVRRPDYRVYGGETPTHGTLLAALREFFTEGDTLRSVWSTRQEDAVRAAAGILMLGFADFSNGEKPDHFETLIKSYDPSFGAWYFPCAFGFLTPAIKRQDAFALDFADEALELVREDISARAALENVLNEWREIARSPVHATLDSGFWK